MATQGGKVPHVIGNLAFKIAEADISKAYNIVARQVHIDTPLGLRITDILAREKITGILAGFEVKANTSVYSGLQQMKDKAIEAGLGKFFGLNAGDLRGATAKFATTEARVNTATGTVSYSGAQSSAMGMQSSAGSSISPAASNAISNGTSGLY